MNWSAYSKIVFEQIVITRWFLDNRWRTFFYIFLGRFGKFSHQCGTRRCIIGYFCFYSINITYIDNVTCIRNGCKNRLVNSYAWGTASKRLLTFRVVFGIRFNCFTSSSQNCYTHQKEFYSICTKDKLEKTNPKWLLGAVPQVY